MSKKIEVKYIKNSDDTFRRKGNCAYFFKDEQSGNLYKWSTSYHENYNIYEGKTYFIAFNETNEIEDNAIRIKNVRISEKAQESV